MRMNTSMGSGRRVSHSCSWFYNLAVSLASTTLSLDLDLTTTTSSSSQAADHRIQRSVVHTLQSYQFVPHTLREHVSRRGWTARWRTKSSPQRALCNGHRQEEKNDEQSLWCCLQRGDAQAAKLWSAVVQRAGWRARMVLARVIVGRPVPRVPTEEFDYAIRSSASTLWSEELVRLIGLSMRALPECWQ